MMGAAIATACIAALTVPYDRAALETRAHVSTRVVARDGSALRVTLGADETRAAWLPLDAISPRLVQATLAAEDRRFRRHPGSMFLRWRVPP